jgi:condensin complex subunit 2
VGLRDATGTPGRNVSGTLGAAPLVVESQRYEEWMKRFQVLVDVIFCARAIASESAAWKPSGERMRRTLSVNTWNLALIDYFHDMSLLRNGEDNSINFQKASCTLDGAVKR